MIINIIFIIYNKIKFNTYELYLAIIQFLYFLLCTILTLHTYTILSLSKTNIYNNKFAFNINIVYLSENLKKIQLIQKIQIEHYNLVFIKKLTENNKFLFNINFLNQLDIKKKIELLKNYGFLKKIKLLSIKSINRKYIILNFTFNPILKKVKIKEQKKLLIPKKVLVNIFYQQIGLPKNYININQSIQNIYRWYQSRGFIWVNINLIETKNSEEIALKICEGKIITSSLKCIENDIIPYKIKNYTENKINKELYFTNNQILNSKKLEHGIKSLKKNKILKDCNYSIKKTNNGINIFFQYSLIKSHSSFLLQQETVFKSNKNIFLLYEYYLHENKQLSLKIYRKITDDSCRKIFKLYYPVKSIFCKIKDEITVHIQSLLQNFTLKYYLYNYQQNFTIDININSQSTDANILFFVPSTIFTNYSFNYIVLNFYYRYYKSIVLKHIQILCLLNSYHFKKEIVYTQALFFNFNISLRKNIDKYISLKVKLASQFNKSNQIIINIINYNQNNLYVNIKGKLINVLLEKVTKSIKQNLVNIKIAIKYNNLYITKQIKSGQLYILELVYLIPLLLDTSYNIYKVQPAKQSFYFIYKQSHILPKVIKYVYNHLIFVIIKINCLVSEKSYIRILKNNINCNPVKPLYISRLEYSIYIFSDLSSYIFCGFTQNLNEYDKSKSLYINQLNKLCNCQMNIGCGIQFNIPIHNIPTFRIEYKLSNNKNNFLQLRLYSQYND